MAAVGGACVPLRRLPAFWVLGCLQAVHDGPLLQRCMPKASARVVITRPDPTPQLLLIDCGLASAARFHFVGRASLACP